MHTTEWQTAVTDLLEYCRDPRHSLGRGRQLGPVLLQKHCPTSFAAWKLADDWALAAEIKELIRTQIVHLRALAHNPAPVSTNPVEHMHMLKHDSVSTSGRDELKFWSLLWAYYICALTTDEIAQVCGWGIRTSQLRIKEAREVYLVQKLAELAHCQRQSR